MSEDRGEMPNTWVEVTLEYLHELYAEIEALKRIIADLQQERQAA